MKYKIYLSASDCGNEIYFNKELWEHYLLSHFELSSEFLNDIPPNLNKGIQFEVLVECLLKHKYGKINLSFQKTKLSHDGNKDFWAIDNAKTTLLIYH